MNDVTQPFLGFFTHSRNLSVLFVTLWVTSPLERDIIYGWSLSKSTK